MEGKALLESDKRRAELKSIDEELDTGLMVEPVKKLRMVRRNLCNRVRGTLIFCAICVVRESRPAPGGRTTRWTKIQLRLRSLSDQLLRTTKHAASASMGS